MGELCQPPTFAEPSLRQKLFVEFSGCLPPFSGSCKLIVDRVFQAVGHPKSRQGRPSVIREADNFLFYGGSLPLTHGFTKFINSKRITFFNLLSPVRDPVSETHLGNSLLVIRKTGALVTEFNSYSPVLCKPLGPVLQRSKCLLYKLSCAVLSTLRNWL